MTEIDAAKDRAAELSHPSKFSFMERLQGRGFAEDEVEIYLDEAAGHRIAKLTEQFANEKNGEQADIIAKQIEFQREKAAKSRYTVHLRGISAEDYDSIVDASAEQFPVEFRETRNPLSMALERTVVENEDRELYFRTHHWARSIVKVVDADGNVDDEITPEWVGYFLKHAPLMAQMRIAQKVEELKMVSDWMDKLQGDDFLASA